MKWLLPLREISLTVATITAIVAQAMGQLTLTLSAAGAFTSLSYATICIAAGVFSILSIPLILTLDMAQEQSYTATVLFEIVWMVFLSVMWIVTAVQTMGPLGSTFKSCSSSTAKNFTSICSFAQTIQLFSLLTAGILLLYTASLVVAGFMAQSSGRPIWTKFSTGKKH